MSETQLASMFIGSADDGDDIDRGRPSDVGNMIHILDGQTDVILDFITLDNIIDDTHKKSLEDTLETYDFIALADKRYAAHLEKRNRIIIPDEDGTLREFVIFEAAKYRDTEGYKAQVFSHASYLELKKARILYPTRREGLTASQHAGWALNDTGWRVGIVEAEGTRTFTIENHTNPYEFLKRIAREFEVELRFRVEHDGRRITARYVDFLERIGDWKGREVEFGRDLDSIRRVEKQDIVTALLGLGPERDDGTRIEVLVTDEEALQRWGRVDEHGNLHHLIEPYEIQSERTEMTEEEARQYTRTALDKRINTQVTYETTILDLEEVPGLEHEKIRFGDTIRIKDVYFNPPLYLEARVYEIERSIKNKAKKDIKLGDYIEYTEEEVHAIWRQLRNQIRRRITAAQLVEYAEPKKVESSTPPPIKEGENPIWVDTSKTPHVPHVVIANEWVKMSPTEAQEVGAETPQGAQSKANQALSSANQYTQNYTYSRQKIDQDIAEALDEAKAYSENAENIKRGIIDVGAVPLRTSRTGARIEWDGVNGFVQYDQSGNPVNWFNLDGELYATNGYFTGTVNANAGYFGDNLSLVNGKLRITRPDGAVWMEDGMVRQDYSVSTYDPHYMTMGLIKGGSNIPADRFEAFFVFSGFYQQDLGSLDGRGTPSIPSEDVRDPDYGWTVRFQRYEFVHTARYLKIAYRIANNSQVSKHRLRLYEAGTPPTGYDPIYYHATYEKGDTGLKNIVIDLGVPSYQVRRVDLRLGWNLDWGSPTEILRFRIERVVQSDYL